MNYFIGQWRYRNKDYRNPLIVVHLEKDDVVAQFYNHRLCGEYLAPRTELSGLPTAEKQKQIAKKLAAAELCNALGKAARYK